MRDQLRDEVRAAFQKEQGAHPPAPDLRPSITRSMTVRPARSPNLRWVAVVAALLITALVIAGLVSSRGALRTQAPAHASPRGDVATGEDYGPPPPGVPLIYLRDPYNAGWYTGFDWGGQPRATIKLAQAAGSDATLIQDSNGSLFVLSPSGKGAGGQLLDRLGKPVTGTAGIWADDNLHTCWVAFDQQALTWTLVTGGPNLPAQNVAVIAHDPVGQTGITVAACSFKRDVAIAVRTSIMWPSQMWVITLSSGQVSKPIDFSSSEHLASVVASADASLLAENSTSSFGGNKGTQPTVIRRTADGSVVTTLDGTLGVLGFSADDSLALVESPAVSAQSGYFEVIEVATGKAVWRYDTDKQYVRHIAQPGGGAFAIVLTGSVTPNFPVTVLIVYSDGRSIELPAGYLRP